jgi:predicted RNA-binding Zn-ribbon protein involved in translation (DUF1610 family)
MQTECVQCHAPIEVPDDRAGEKFKCPACAAATPITASKSDELVARRDLLERREKIRAKAAKFEAGAAVFLFLAVIIFGTSLASSVNAESGSRSYGFSLASLAGCFLSYLIAQAIHIRANTEH